MAWPLFRWVEDDFPMFMMIVFFFVCVFLRFHFFSKIGFRVWTLLRDSQVSITIGSIGLDDEPTGFCLTAPPPAYLYAFGGFQTWGYPTNGW